MIAATRLLTLCVTLIVVSALTTPNVAGQTPNPSARRPAGSAAARQQAPMALALTIAGKAYALSQPARCVHAARASSFNRPGQYWTVEVRPQTASGLRSLSLNVWRFTDKSETFSLSAEVDRSSYQVSTTEPNMGRGTASVTPHDGGGKFTIDATTQEGTSIKGTVDCERFAPATSEGG